MNSETLASKWNQLRSPIQRRWDKVTNLEIDQINGNYDKLVRKLQEHYGCTREFVDREVEKLEHATHDVTSQEQ